MRLAKEIAEATFGLEMENAGDVWVHGMFAVDKAEIIAVIAAKLEPVREVVEEQQAVLAATLRFITQENMFDEYLAAMKAAGIKNGFGVRGKDVLIMLSDE